MELMNERCVVQITADTMYTVQSADNKRYDAELNPDDYKRGDSYKALAIHADLLSKEISIVLVGDFYSYDANCAVLNDTVLTVLQGSAISQIELSTGSLRLHKRIECCGCTFGLYSIPGGFIIWGETEIVRLDLNFDRVWGFSGRDIFVSQSQKTPFELCENSIKLCDWEDNCYELDLNGNLI